MRFGRFQGQCARRSCVTPRFSLQHAYLSFPAREDGEERWGAEPSLKFASALCLRRKKKKKRLVYADFKSSVLYAILLFVRDHYTKGATLSVYSQNSPLLEWEGLRRLFTTNSGHIEVGFLCLLRNLWSTLSLFLFGFFFPERTPGRSSDGEKKRKKTNRRRSI